MRYLNVLIVFMVVANAQAWDCDHTRKYEKTLSAESIKKLNLTTGAGLLELKGEAGLERILVKAELCAESQEDLDSMSVSVTSASLDGELIGIVETNIPEESMWSSSRQRRIDLGLTVPPGLAIEIKDTSGSIVAEKCRRVRHRGFIWFN